MMKPDWRLIELENRGLFVRSTRFLGEGWCSRAYLVNDELVFRFPKRPEQWRELDREIKFLAFAADHLTLPVPRYVYAAPVSPGATHGYAVYRYLSGHPMDATVLTRDERAAAADRIAAFLRALHDLDPNPEVGSLLPHDDERIVAKQWFARAEREIAPKLRPSEARALHKQFEMHLSAPGNFSFRPVVIHADFSRDHILMDDNSVVAVIDFGDANWGDPDYDFVYLFRDCGEAFVKDVARSYGHPDVEQLKMKFKYFDLVDQVDTILNGVGHALEGQEHSAWRRLKQLLRTS